jgi:hypothetical protein
MDSFRCEICIRLSQFYQNCAHSIQQLKRMAQAAQTSCDFEREEDVIETIHALELESSELLVAITEHRRKAHCDHLH